MEISKTVETIQEARLWFHIMNYKGLSSLILNSESYGKGYSKDVATTVENSNEVHTFLIKEIERCGQL